MFAPNQINGSINDRVPKLIFIIICIAKVSLQVFCRVVPDTDFAGYPANNFAGKVKGVIHGDVRS